MTAAKSDTSAAPPIRDFIKRDDAGAPYISGSQCEACGYTYIGERSHCAQCYARDQMKPVRIAETGKLYSWSIVHRSFPGAETPFIDVIVDLEDGSHIKGILKNVAPDPEKIPFDLPVRIKFDEVIPIGQTEPYLAYHFVPE